MLFDGHRALAEHIHPGTDAEAGRFWCSHAAVDALWRAIGDADGHVAVEVGGAEKEFRWRALREVRDGRRRDIATPRILERHRDAHAYTEIAGLLNFGETAKFADLEVHHVHGEVGLRAKEDAKVIDGFVQHERVRNL